MKVKREWMNEQDVFEFVTEALDQAAAESPLGDETPLVVTSFAEEGAYGDDGTVNIQVGDRRFTLELHEIL